MHRFYQQAALVAQARARATTEAERRDLSQYPYRSSKTSQTSTDVVNSAVRPLLLLKACSANYFSTRLSTISTRRAIHAPKLC